MKKLIVKINPNTSVKKDDYIINPTYGLGRAITDSSGGKYNQVGIKLIPSGAETTVAIFTGAGLYKVSLGGKGIGQGVDQRKAIKYLFK